MSFLDDELNDDFGRDSVSGGSVFVEPVADMEDIEAQYSPQEQDHNEANNGAREQDHTEANDGAFLKEDQDYQQQHPTQEEGYEENYKAPRYMDRDEKQQPLGAPQEQYYQRPVYNMNEEQQQPHLRYGESEAIEYTESEKEQRQPPPPPPPHEQHCQHPIYNMHVEEKEQQQPQPQLRYGESEEVPQYTETDYTESEDSSPDGKRKSPSQYYPDPKRHQYITDEQGYPAEYSNNAGYEEDAKMEARPSEGDDVMQQNPHNYEGYYAEGTGDPQQDHGYASMEDHQQGHGYASIDAHNQGYSDMAPHNYEGHGHMEPGDFEVHPEMNQQDFPEDAEASHQERWQDFVENVNTKDSPVLDEYLQAKDACIAKQHQFQQALGQYFDALKSYCQITIRTTDSAQENNQQHEQLNPFLRVSNMGMIEDVSRSAVALRNDKMSWMAKDITETFLSNHHRRNGLFDKLDEADNLWKAQYATLTSDLLGGAHSPFNHSAVMGTGETDENEISYYGEDSTTEEMEGYTHSYQPESNGHLSNLGEASGYEGEEEVSGEARQHVEGGDFYEEAPQEAEEGEISGQTWMEISQFEPARLGVEAFLCTKDDFESMKNYMDAVHNEFETALAFEVSDIIEMVEVATSNLETNIAALEYDIEATMMDNNRRRGDQTQRLQESAQNAQALFQNLLSSLMQSMR
ncbi:MAG: hypothetical protein SGILL_004115 [Bacillariaceae sp.]